MIEERLKLVSSNQRTLLDEVEKWEKSYRHLRPCEEFKRTGFCMHMYYAEARKFRDKNASFLKGIEILFTR